MRIAVATSNGEKVNQHFGKATSFNIYDMEGDSLKLVEKREVQSYCECENGEPVDPNHKFSTNRFTLVQEKIKDCKKLYTVQIGDKPRKQLEIVGIDVQLCSCDISKIPDFSGNCK